MRFARFMDKGDKGDRRAIIVACTAYHIDKFTLGQINILKRLGFEVSVAASFDAKMSGNSSEGYVGRCMQRLLSMGVKVFDLPFTRSPLSVKNARSFITLKRLLKENNYSLLHCHTPTGGFIARVSADRKNGMRVIYTAHGFHFFKGAPVLNWLFFYPAERYLARRTDCLVVINKEDEQIARRKMRAGFVARMNGVGVLCNPYSEGMPYDRKTLGLNSDAFVFLCVGELSKRKNQGVLIKSFSLITDKCPNAVLILAGEGRMRAEYESLTDSLKLNDKVFFLGWRDDVPSLVLMSDVIVSAAKQEGLPVNLIEAMMAGKPIIASGCRGNRELAEQAGLIADDESGFPEAMALLYNDAELRTRLGQASKKASHKYEAAVVDGEMERLYRKIISKTKGKAIN